MSGVICGNTVQGANQAGVYTYVKHFICNDGESGIYRDSVYTWMTEQALREIYLRPFQMLVEDYDAVGLMSSYNRIGAVWAGGSEALLTGILGAVAGIVLAVNGISIVSLMNRLTPIISADTILLGLGAGALVGVLAGLYPAAKASRIDPAQTLAAG